MRRYQPVLLLLLALWLPVLLQRGLLLHGETLPAGAADLRGLLGDLGVGLLFAALAAAGARLWRGVAPLLAGIWALLWWANYEQIHALDGSLSLRYADHMLDPTFVAGSVLTLSSPVAGFGTLFGAVGLAWLAVRRREKVAVWPLGLAAALLVGATLLWPPSEETIPWRQESFLVENVRDLVLARPLPGPPERPPADLAGAPRVALDRKGNNVLLVVLEGFSGGYIGPVAEANGRPDGAPTPELDRLARRGLLFTNVVASQRQTNRGLYSLLCGDYPFLGNGLPHMNRVVAEGAARCLPGILADAGYGTLFAQAAPLPFQQMGEFMHLAGFARVLGDESFAQAWRRNEWGVDDRAFFEQSVPLIEELQADGRPWFATLVTSGTHHPFDTVPETLDPAGDARLRAIRHADETVGRFVARLEEAGILERTAVIITSDESLGLPDSSDPRLRTLAGNWGFVIALLPGAAPQRVEDPCSQVDMTLTLLDYLGIRHEVDRFTGRSLLRSYAEGPVIAFANTYFRWVGGLTPDGTVYRCDEFFTRCLRWRTDGGRLFAPRASPELPTSLDEADFLQRIAAFSRR